MNKQVIAKHIEDKYDCGFVNVSQVSSYMKISRGNAAILLKGLEYFQTGRERKYHVFDVASRICENRRA